MPRKYSGPLRQGERSAKVTVRPKTITLSNAPARFRVGRNAYRKSTRMARAMSSFGETKLTAIDEGNEIAPVTTQVGSQVYKYTMATGGTAPSTWTGYNAVGGFQYVQGAGPNERVGRYMYLNHTTINMSVHMNPVKKFQAPTQFRMIVFKARRVVTPTGTSYNPNTTLFLNDVGDNVGPGTGGFNGNDIQLLPLNKKQWIILQDKKFTLQSPYNPEPDETTPAVWQGKYPNFKQCRLTLNHKRKVSFTNTAEPGDFDYHYGIAIFATSVARDQPASTWEVNYRGTTSSQDS